MEGFLCKPSIKKSPTIWQGIYSFKRVLGESA